MTLVGNPKGQAFVTVAVHLYRVGAKGKGKPALGLAAVSGTVVTGFSQFLKK